MERVATIVCRGCLTETDAQVVSLQVAGIRDLYESCTRLKVLVDIGEEERRIYRISRSLISAARSRHGCSASESVP